MKTGLTHNPIRLDDNSWHQFLPIAIPSIFLMILLIITHRLFYSSWFILPTVSGTCADHFTAHHLPSCFFSCLLTWSGSHLLLIPVPSPCLRLSMFLHGGAGRSEHNRTTTLHINYCSVKCSFDYSESDLNVFITQKINLWVLPITKHISICTMD